MCFVYNISEDTTDNEMHFVSAVAMLSIIHNAGKQSGLNYRFQI